MPAKASWITHIPEMIDTICALTVPVLDRAGFERLFKVRRRRAISLMKYFGGYRAGSSILVDRMALVKRLERMQQEPATGYEVHRKRQLAEHLALARQTRLGMKIKIPVPEDARDREFQDLPDGIEIAPGRVVFTFKSAEQLFSNLYEFSQAAANDYDRVCAAVEDAMPQRLD
jgi:hypothetical protein